MVNPLLPYPKGEERNSIFYKGKTLRLAVNETKVSETKKRNDSFSSDLKDEIIRKE